eukprot:34180-Amphidinium_carterae.1
MQVPTSEKSNVSPHERRHQIMSEYEETQPLDERCYTKTNTTSKGSPRRRTSEHLQGGLRSGDYSNLA